MAKRKTESQKKFDKLDEHTRKHIQEMAARWQLRKAQYEYAAKIEDPNAVLPMKVSVMREMELHLMCMAHQYEVDGDIILSAMMWRWIYELPHLAEEKRQRQIDRDWDLAQIDNLNFDLEAGKTEMWVYHSEEYLRLRCKDLTPAQIASAHRDGIKYTRLPDNSGVGENRGALVSRAQTEWLNVYRPTFGRALNSYVINGFFARDLDADDFEFLEQAKLRGIANSTVPGTSEVLAEELGFWQSPYSFDASIKPRVGPVRMRGAGELPEVRALRQAKWRARVLQREADKEIAAAELAREQAAWEAARKERLGRRELASDEEWEQADPRRWRKAKHLGQLKGRYYKPRNWDFNQEREAEKWLAEQRRVKAEKAKLVRDTAAFLGIYNKLHLQQTKLEASLQPKIDARDRFWEKARANYRAMQARHLERQALKAKAERDAKEREERAAQHAKWAEAQRVANAERRVAEERAREAKRAEWAEAMRAQREEDARKAAEAARRQDPREMAKDKLCRLICDAYPGRWKMGNLMLALGVKDEQVVHQLAAELVREGRLQVRK